MIERRLPRRALLTRLASVAQESLREARGKIVATSPPVDPEAPLESEMARDQIVRVQPAACIAFRGTLCSVCVERCPEPGAIVTNYGRPEIVAEHCTGCGECVQRCPAPVNALTLHDR